ncbi:rho-associated protein kinase 1-like [Pungitius pungitius]|uniref:rho-associated protein kinase 1-like n=1 Tax=Pungitius pungitius TaxID=134920 RepID=UPI002E11EB9A
MTNVQKKEMLSEELNSFYLSSLEEQVRAQMEDNNAMITETESVGRVLLQIDVDRLQQFLDLLQEHKNGDLHKEMCSPQDQLQAQQMKVDKEALPNDVEAIQSMTFAEMNWITAAKTNLELELESELEFERAQRKEHINKHNDEMEKMAAALKLLQNMLDTSRQQVSCLRRQVGSSRADTLHKLQTQDKVNRKRTACLKKTFKDQLESEHLKWKQEKASMLENSNSPEVEKSNNDDLLAAVKKAEQQLESRTIEWEQERTSFKARLEKTCQDLEHAQLKNITAVHTLEKEAVEMSERNQALQDQLESEHLKWKQEKASMLENSNSSKEVEKKKNDDLLAAVKKAEQQLESRTIEWEQERTSFKARLEKTCQDLEHAQLKNITAVHIMEKEAVDMSERNQAFHYQLEEQRAETIKITRALKETEDLLEKQGLSFQQLTSQLETSCVTKMKAQEEDHNNLLAALQKKFEDESDKWHHINSCLAQTAEQTLEREKEHLNDNNSLLSQLEELQQKTTMKPKKKWYKFF